MLYFNILMIVFIAVYVIDISGFMVAVNKTVYKWIYGSLKRYDGLWYIPVLSCAKCASVWATIAYCLCNGVPFLTSVFLGCVASLLAIVLSLVMKRMLYLVNKYIG